MKHMYVQAAISCLILCWMMDTVLSTEVDLIYLNNYVSGNVNQYQARCSVPCSATYQPDELEVTIKYNIPVYNLWTFGHFYTEQESPRSVWEIANSNWMSPNSQKLCSFDVQIDYPLDTPVPTGTCKKGWDPPPCSDVPGRTVSGESCEDIKYDQLHQCYNQTVSDLCCYSCNKYKMDLPNCEYGDRSQTDCPTINDRECYNKNTNTKCCMTCDEIERLHQGTYSMPNCPYGNRLEDSYCSTINRSECYTKETQCCDTCFWLAEERYPDCRYGNRAPCDQILNRDCYNTSIATECCDICIGLQDDEHPDCLYGDKDKRCSGIDRQDCYDTDIRTGCCRTCMELANPDNPECVYGDRGDCEDVTASNCSSSKNLRENTCCEKCDFLLTNDCREVDEDYCELGLYRQDCYDSSIRYDCCQFCYGEYDGSISAFNCAFGDKEDWCWYGVDSQDCYKNRIQRTCCETCAYYALDFLEEDCKFGDRTPNDCYFISASDCYNNNIGRNCCEQCSYWEIPDYPSSCKYGDRSSECYSIPPFECYDTTTERKCCGTCLSADISDQYGDECRYGNRDDSCYTEPIRECYNTGFQFDCCKYCADTANPEKPGCMYGDKSDRCNRLQVGDCYELKDTCCITCPYYEIHLGIDDCKYGDRQNCSTLQPADCNDPEIAYKCCMTCYRMQGASNDCPFGDTASDCATISPRDCYSRERECCKTCQTYVIGNSDVIDNCDYGDRGSNCATIEDRQCYSPFKERECCATCYNRRHLPITDEDCLYGNRINSCTDVRFHSSECYNITRRQFCCETCQQLRTNDNSCRYGDKEPVCQTIQSSNVYMCYQLETSCCQTCPYYRNDNLPACKYGDAMLDCRESECSEYSDYDLSRCCNTCKDYVTPPVTDTTTPSTTSPTTSDDTGVTQSPDKQTGKPHKTSTISKTTSSEETSWTREITTPDVFKTTDTTEKTKSDQEKILEALASIGPIVGGAVGGVVLIVIIIGVVCFLMRRNKADKYRQKNDGFQPQPIRSGVSYSNNQPAPSYNPVSIQSQPYPQSQRPTLKRQDTKDEVYDYINPDDVKSVVSEPAARPNLPDRPGNDAGYYTEPISSSNNYNNQGYKPDSADTDNHTYHILQKDDNYSGHNYTSI